MYGALSGAVGKSGTIFFIAFQNILLAGMEKFFLQ
jgi:hypothetical protein